MKTSTTFLFDSKSLLKGIRPEAFSIVTWGQTNGYPDLFSKTQWKKCETSSRSPQISSRFKFYNVTENMKMLENYGYV